MIRLLVG